MSDWHPLRLLHDVAAEPLVAEPISPLFLAIGALLGGASVIASRNGASQLELIGMKLTFLATLLAAPRFLATGAVGELDRRWLAGSLIRYQRGLARLLRRLNKIGVLVVLWLVLPLMMVTSEVELFAGGQTTHRLFGYLLVGFVFGTPLLLIDWCFNRRSRSGRWDAGRPMTVARFFEESRKDPTIPVFVLGLLVFGAVFQILGTAS